MMEIPISLSYQIVLSDDKLTSPIAREKTYPTIQFPFISL